MKCNAIDPQTPKIRLFSIKQTNSRRDGRRKSIEQSRQSKECPDVNSQTIL